MALRDSLSNFGVDLAEGAGALDLNLCSIFSPGASPNFSL
jgi:hypothetical protein